MANRKIQPRTPSGTSEALVVTCLAAMAISALALSFYFIRLLGFSHIVETNDFRFFYHAASLLHAGGEVYSLENFRYYLAHNGDGDVLPFVYPPPFLLFIAPLGLMTVTIAAVVWLFAQQVCLLLAIASLPREQFFPYLARRGNGCFWAVLLAAILPYEFITALAGQSGMLTSALAIAACGNLRTRPKLAGICIGLFIVKPPLALAIGLALLMGREWRVLALAVATALAVSLLTIILWGWPLWQNYFPVFLEQGRLAAQGPQRMTGLMVSIYGTARYFGLSYGCSMGLQGAGMAAVVFFIARTIRHRGESWFFGLLLAASLLVSPYIFIYDLPLLGLPLALIADRGLAGKLGFGEGMLFAFASASAIMLLEHNEFGIPAPLIVAIGLCCLCYQRIRQKAVNDHHPVATIG